MALSIEVIEKNNKEEIPEYKYLPNQYVSIILFDNKKIESIFDSYPFYPTCIYSDKNSEILSIDLEYSTKDSWTKHDIKLPHTEDVFYSIKIIDRGEYRRGNLDFQGENELYYDSNKDILLIDFDDYKGKADKYIRIAKDAIAGIADDKLVSLFFVNLYQYTSNEKLLDITKDMRGKKNNDGALDKILNVFRK